MKVLQIGAGSMGTRRLRDLAARADVTLALHEARADRREAAQRRFRIPAFATLDEAIDWRPEILVISTPPGTKGPFIELALERSCHHFSEADIWSYDGAAIERRCAEKGIVGVPSASLLFLPVVKTLAAVVADELGDVVAYEHFMATYMPNWHPAEGPEYYGRHRDTAPAREMVPFELAFLQAIFGPAIQAAGHFGKAGALPDATEDTWSLLLRLPRQAVGKVGVTMACPSPFRRGSCFGTRGRVDWDIYGGGISVQSSSHPAERRFEAGAMTDTLETMYRTEIDAFLAAVTQGAVWPQSYGLSQQACGTLAAAERSAVSGRWENVHPLRDPERAPPRT